MNKVNGEFDQIVSLGLGVIGVVQPIIKVFFISEPKHGVRSVLHPKALFPFLHNNRAKGNARQDVSLIANQFNTRQRCRTMWSLPCQLLSFLIRLNFLRIEGGEGGIAAIIAAVPVILVVFVLVFTLIVVRCHLLVRRVSLVNRSWSRCCGKAAIGRCISLGHGRHLVLRRCLQVVFYDLMRSGSRLLLCRCCRVRPWIGYRC